MGGMRVRERMIMCPHFFPVVLDNDNPTADLPRCTTILYNTGDVHPLAQSHPWRSRQSSTWRAYQLDRAFSELTPDPYGRVLAS